MNDLDANKRSWGGEVGGRREVEERKEWILNDREANEDEGGSRERKEGEVEGEGDIEGEKRFKIEVDNIFRKDKLGCNERLV